jgi:hypothetical protein
MADPNTVATLKAAIAAGFFGGVSTPPKPAPVDNGTTRCEQHAATADVPTSTIATTHTRSSQVIGETIKVVTPARQKTAEEIAAARATILDNCISTFNQLHFINFSNKVGDIFARLMSSPSLKRPSLFSYPRKPEETYSNDTLDVSRPTVINSNFTPEQNRGISPFRPEIISILNFKPIYVGDPKHQDLNSHGRMIEVQHQASLVRRDSLGQLLLSLNATAPNQNEAAEIFNEVKASFQKELGKTNNTITFYGQAIDNIELLSSLLDIKKNSDHKNQQDQALGLVGLKEFYKQYMGFTDDQYDKFSATKIYSQLLSDFRQVLENYSFNLLDLVDSDRPNDTSPTTIDTTFTVSDGFDFRIEQLRSNTGQINAAEMDFFRPFLKSLPSSTEDRIKLLISVMSKEYLVSRGLGDPGVARKLEADFGSGNTGNPFDNIIGVIGKSIFDATTGGNSLASFANRPIELANSPGANPDSFVVLPFESKYVDSTQDNKVYVPGRSFYVDSIFDLISIPAAGQPGANFDFNTGPLTQFSNEFASSYVKARDNTLSLLDLFDATGLGNSRDAASQNLQGDQLYVRFLDSLKTSMSSIDRKLNGQPEPRSIEALQSFSIALFRLANTDSKLKQLLFQYLLMGGLLSNLDNNRNSVWTELAFEFGVINSFPSIDVPFTFAASTTAESTTPVEGFTAVDVSLLNGPKVVAPFFPQIIEAIEKRVRRIVLGESASDIKKIKKHPDITRDTINLFQNALKNSTLPNITTLTNSGWPVTMGVSTEFIKNALTQIVHELNYEKDPNVIRQFIDLVNKITNDASIGGARGYLLDDGTARTRFNFLSTSTQMLVIFETFSGIVDKFGFSDFKNLLNINLTVETNSELARFISLNIEDVSGDQFASQPSSLGGFTKLVRAELGTDSALEHVRKEMGHPPAGAWGGGPPLVALTPTGLGTRDEREASKKADNSTKTNLLNSLKSIKTKLAQEKVIAANFLYVLGLINDNIAQAGAIANNTYNKGTISRFLQDSGTIQDLRTIRTVSQLRTNAAIVDKMHANSLSQNMSPALVNLFGQGQGLPISNIVPTDVKEAMYLYLTQPDFQETAEAATRMKIVSVGVPAEFTKSLVDRIDFANVNANSFKRKEVDVISVNIFKRDLRQPNLIFKPQKFVFDLSLYQREQEIIDEVKPELTETWDKIVQRNVVADFTDINSKTFYSLNGRNTNQLGTSRSIKADQKYSFLSIADREAVFLNHFKSLLLENYIKLTTGMNISEETFLVSEGDDISTEVNQKFETLLLSYIKDVLGQDIPTNQTTEQLLNNPNVNQQTKDILRSVRSGTPIISPKTSRDRALRPKKYDRVFHVPLNIDKFEIDAEETVKSEAGRRTFEQANVQNQIRKETVGGVEKTFLQKRTDRDIVFEDFFVVLESRS